MKVEQNVLINIPPGEIFTYVSNLENMIYWCGAVVSARKIASEDMLVGTTVQCSIRILGKWFVNTYEVIECVPNRYFTIKSITSVAPMLVSYRFEPVEDGGTKVFVEESIQFTGGYLGFTEPLIKNVILRQISNDLLTLKDMLESTSSL